MHWILNLKTQDCWTWLGLTYNHTGLGTGTSSNFELWKFRYYEKNKSQCLLMSNCKVHTTSGMFLCCAGTVGDRLYFLRSVLLCLLVTSWNSSSLWLPQRLLKSNLHQNSLKKHTSSLQQPLAKVCETATTSVIIRILHI